MNALINGIATELTLSNQQLDSLLNSGFVLIEQACSPALFSALQQESQQLEQQDNQFHEARLIAGSQNAQVRSDSTRWLQPSDAAGSQYLVTLENLGKYLNQQLYSGIRRVEAHYAIYQAGDFYKPHRDNPSKPLNAQPVRVFSTVLYLNSDWQAAWQGELHLQDLHDKWHLILPMPNRLVIFDSNLLHEVRPATCPRRSIAGWLRQDTVLV